MPTSEALHALVIDADATLRAELAARAGRVGFVVEQAADGAEALAAAGRLTFDLLLCDDALTGVSAHDVVERFRSDDRTRDVYAIMLTHHLDVGTKIAALTAGFDDLITKSAGEEEVIAELLSARRLIVRQRTLDVTVRELYGLATRDELTGIFNRRFFESEVERLLAAGTSISLVLFDLDHFKQVNDSLGHLAGDQILRDLGALLLRITRPEDLIARYGGDEFVMIVRDLSIADVAAITARIGREIAAMEWTIAGQSIRIGVSTGSVSSAGVVDATVTTLVDAADRDLYKNKYLRRHAAPVSECESKPAPLTPSARADARPNER